MVGYGGVLAVRGTGGRRSKQKVLSLTSEPFPRRATVLYVVQGRDMLGVEHTPPCQPGDCYVAPPVLPIVLVFSVANPVNKNYRPHLR